MTFEEYKWLLDEIEQVRKEVLVTLQSVQELSFVVRTKQAHDVTVNLARKNNITVIKND